MQITLMTEITVGDICKGFCYDENKEKEALGFWGQVKLQPDYQRKYIYSDGKRDEAVIRSLLKGYPLGGFCIGKIFEGEYEVIDGQQRLISLGRFVTGKFAIKDINVNPCYFSQLEREEQERILKTPLIIHMCKGSVEERKELFQVLNTTSVLLNGIQ